MSETIQQRTGFIGTGQMATALAAGFVRNGLVDPARLHGYDVSPNAAERFATTTGGKSVESIQELVAQSDVIFFAVKPQHLREVLASMPDKDSPLLADKLVITIVAGIPLSVYCDRFGSNLRCVRVMPNTPCLVGEAASGFSRSKGAQNGDAELVKRLLDTVGLAYEVPEPLLNAVTGLSGSGPAYVFMMIEALSDGGVRMGLPRAIALELAAQTLKGSAEMFLKTKEHPGSLKDRVTSPAGTTIAGVAALEAGGLRSALINAVEAATRRSEELGRS